MRFSAKYVWLSVSVLLISSVLTNAQSRHSVKNTDTADGAIISVTAWRTDEKKTIRSKSFIYETERAKKKISLYPSRRASFFWLALADGRTTPKNKQPRWNVHTKFRRRPAFEVLTTKAEII